MANKGSNPERVYWDSCVYLDWLLKNHPLHDQMQMVMDDWKAGTVTLITSALTIAEVMYVKCPPENRPTHPEEEHHPEIAALFDPPPSYPFIVVELNRLTATKARQLNWDLGVRPKDAVHIASAIEGRCDVMHTNDDELIELLRARGGVEGLRVEHPSWTKQMEVDPAVEPGRFSSLVETSEPAPPDEQSPDVAQE